MKEILRQEVQKCKEQMESSCYSFGELQLPDKRYYCGWRDCNYKPRQEEIIVFIDNDLLRLFCVKCWNSYLEEEIYTRVKARMVDRLKKTIQEVIK